MKPLHRVVFLCAFIGCLGGMPLALADENPQQADRSLTGDKVCTKCHDESEKVPILAMYKTRHGVKADTRTPGCQGCHGASEAHVKNPGGSATSIRPTPDVTFGAKKGKYYAKSNPQVQSDTCVGCHQVGKRDHWAGSTHQTRDVACSSCHQIHTHADKVLTKSTQPEVCFTCHKEQRAQINRPSHHPIPEGKMTCTDCHNPHGSVGPKLVKRDSVNETCYTCHMEKRGPFVHTHEPVAEDCSNCHNPHGTTAEAMLKLRPPFLCHSCHTPHGGQVVQLAGQGQQKNFGAGAGAPLISPTTSGKSGINYTQGRGCLNCHTQVHGTNNPATTNPTPQFNLR